MSFFQKHGHMSDDNFEKVMLLKCDKNEFD